MEQIPLNTVLNPVASLLRGGVSEPFFPVLENTVESTKNTLEAKDHIVVTKGYSHIDELLNIAKSSLKKHITVVTRNSEIRDAAYIILAAYNTNIQSQSRELKLNVTYGAYFPEHNDTEYIFFDIPNFGKSEGSKNERKLINYLKENGIQFSFTVFSDKYRNNPYLLSLLDGETVSEKRGDTLKSMHESNKHGTIETRDLTNTNGALNDKEEEQEYAESHMIDTLISDSSNAPTICVTRDHTQGINIGGRLEKSVIVDHNNMENFLLYPDSFNKYDYIIITKQIVGYLNFEEIPSVNLAFFYYASFDKLRKLTKQAIHHKGGSTVIIYNYLYEKWGYDQDNLVQVGKEKVVHGKKINKKENEEKKYVQPPTIVSTETRLGLTDEADLKRYDDDLLEQKVIDDVIGGGNADIIFENFTSKYKEKKDNMYLCELFNRKKPNGKKTVTFREYIKYFTELGVITTPSKTEICKGIKGEGNKIGIEGIPGFLNLRNAWKDRKSICYQDLQSSPYFSMFLIQENIQLTTFNVENKISLIKFLFGEDYREKIKEGAISDLSEIGIKSPIDLLLHAFRFDFDKRSHPFFSQGSQSFLAKAYQKPHLAHIMRLHSNTDGKFEKASITMLTTALFPAIDQTIVNALKTKVQVELGNLDGVENTTDFINTYWNPEYGYFKLLINLGYNEIYPGFPKFSTNSKTNFKLDDLSLLRDFLNDNPKS